MCTVVCGFLPGVTPAWAVFPDWTAIASCSAACVGPRFPRQPPRHRSSPRIGHSRRRQIHPGQTVQRGWLCEVWHRAAAAAAAAARHRRCRFRRRRRCRWRTMRSLCSTPAAEAPPLGYVCLPPPRPLLLPAVAAACGVLAAKNRVLAAISVHGSKPPTRPGLRPPAPASDSNHHTKHSWIIVWG